MNRSFEIKTFQAVGSGTLHPLLTASAFQPTRYLAKELGAELTDFWSRSIADLAAGSAARTFFVTRSGSPLGLLIYADNPWETDLFGRKAAAINTFVVDGAAPDKLQIAQSLLDHAIQDAASRGTQFLLGKTYTDDLTCIHALESRGFQLMDTIVDCVYDYRRTPLASIPAPALPEGVSLRLAAPSDREELSAVAGASFREHFGRYHADERLGRDLATKAYEQWMRSSLDGYADWIHLAVAADKIVGFSIWKRPSKAESQLKVRVGHYSIAGIHPDFHGKGLFTALTHAGMQSLEGIADVIEGPTHINNYGVQFGYAKMGWRVLSDARHSFHKWID
jgi:ribosomal protein S18 acetylase RimI-like enzyme